MKMKGLLLLSLLCTSAFAKTIVGDDGSRLVATLAKKDAKELFQVLDLEEIEGRSAITKALTTKDQIASVNCTLSSLSSSANTQCSIEIDYTATPVKNAVSKDSEGATAYINDNETAEMFYNSLSVEEQEGRSGTYKTFSTSDHRAEIYCSRSNINPINKFTCNLAIKR